MARSAVALSVLAFVCLVAQAAADMHCTEPQKAFYLSYNAISKRDTMEGLFKEVDSKMNKFNYTYNDGKGGVFVISNLVPQLYYNEHHQLETYIGTIRSTQTPSILTSPSEILPWPSASTIASTPQAFSSQGGPEAESCLIKLPTSLRDC